MSTTRIRVSFQGELGAFGELAIVQHWRGGADAVPTRTFASVAELVRDAQVEYGVIPVWNSSIGDVLQGREVVDVLDPTLALDGEVAVPVHHCLLALPGVALESLRTVESHPAALAQCTRFFAEYPWLTPRDAFDTAGAAKELARSATLAPSPDRAVIAPAGAAARYGLTILAAQIQDDADNATRFVVIRRREEAAR
jgi:prephenate dehydratase